MSDYTVRQGDTEPVFAQQFSYEDGTAVNLTGATVTLILRSLTSATPVTLTGQVTITDATNGKVQYRPSQADTATPGDYLANWKVVFGDGSPMTFPTDGFLSVRVEESLTSTTLSTGIRPSVPEVASLLRARTKIRGGTELGTFATGTRPTGGEVEDLIDDALLEVLGKVQPVNTTLTPGSAFNAPGGDYEKRIRGAVRLYAAILIETSYWPEQVRNNQSPVATYQALYESRIRALIAEGEHGQPEGEGAGTSGGAGDAPADAAWAFPAAAPGALVGWSSRW